MLRRAIPPSLARLGIEPQASKQRKVLIVVNFCLLLLKLVCGLLVIDFSCKFQDGVVECTTDTCEGISCPNPVVSPGKCCPTCKG